MRQTLTKCMPDPFFPRFRTRSTWGNGNMRNGTTQNHSFRHIIRRKGPPLVPCALLERISPSKTYLTLLSFLSDNVEYLKYIIKDIYKVNAHHSIAGTALWALGSQGFSIQETTKVVRIHKNGWATCVRLSLHYI